MATVDVQIPQAADLDRGIEIAARVAREMREDPEWKAVTERTQANGPIVSNVQSVFIEATDFSPMK